MALMMMMMMMTTMIFEWQPIPELLVSWDVPWSDFKIHAPEHWFVLQNKHSAVTVAHHTFVILCLSQIRNCTMHNTGTLEHHSLRHLRTAVCNKTLHKSLRSQKITLPDLTARKPATFKYISLRTTAVSFIMASSSGWRTKSTLNWSKML